MAITKAPCPITRQEFRDKAEGIPIKIGNISLVANPKEFSTGSLGWYCNAKITVDVGGKLVNVQVGVPLTIVGSKELPSS